MYALRNAMGAISGLTRSFCTSHSLSRRYLSTSRTSSRNSKDGSASPNSLATVGMLLRFSAAAYVVQVHGVNSTMCVGPSMLPTLNVRGDVLLTEYMSPRFLWLRAGDVVVATKPNDVSVSVIKRIRGMPGDRIWVQRRGGGSRKLIQVPEGHVWLEGDNPRQSTDSREYGPVPIALVRGRILARFWPPTQACIIRSRVIDHLGADKDDVS